MNRVFTLIALLFCCYSSYLLSAQKMPAYAQKENNVWLGGAFTTGYGIDFNHGEPRPASPSTWIGPGGWGTASVCDKSGNLLFYTDGSVVWGRNNLPMPNGFNYTNGLYLFGNSGYLSDPEFDGVVIVPMIDSPHKYYVFSSVRMHTYATYNFLYDVKLFYCVVNMKLNGGLGDLEPGQRGVLLDTLIGGGLHAVAGDNCNFWLIAHDAYGTEFRVYNIDARGIDTTPFISNVGSSRLYGTQIVVSPDRQKIAYVTSPNSAGISMTVPGYLELFKFDPTTGTVSNASTPINTINAYDAAFSPNSCMLYTGSYDTAWCAMQYDVTTGNLLSPVNLGCAGSCFRLGPDGKVYITAISNNSCLGTRIEYPDVAGTACMLVPIAYSIPFLEKSNNGIWFPNEVPVRIYNDTQRHHHQSVLCFDASSVQLAPFDTAGYGYVWSNGGTNIRAIVADPGIYTVRYYSYSPCAVHLDTFVVERVNYSLHLPNDTVICDAGEYLIDAGIDSVSYLWQDGYNEKVYKATTSGEYSVYVERKGCEARDTMFLHLTDITQFIGNDTVVCNDVELQLELVANLPLGAAALWSTGSIDGRIFVFDTGFYSVVVTDSFCTGKDEIQIVNEMCDCTIGIPSVFSPNGDGKNDVFRPVIEPACLVTDFALTIYNRWGQAVYTAFDPTTGWDGTVNGAPGALETYMYYIKLKTGTKRNIFERSGDVTLVR